MILCSTPFGIKVENRATEETRTALRELCSTPFGIKVENSEDAPTDDYTKE